MPAPNFTGGHFVGETFKRFPHICPGSRCAILRWMHERSTRLINQWKVETEMRQETERINDLTAGNSECPL